MISVTFTCRRAIASVTTRSSVWIAGTLDDAGGDAEELAGLLGEVPRGLLDALQMGLLARLDHLVDPLDQPPEAGAVGEVALVQEPRTMQLRGRVLDKHLILREALHVEVTS